MNPLSTIISAGMVRVVSANPKLFDPKKIERAADILARELVKELTRAAKEDDAASEADAAEAPPFELIPADDARAKAYVALRSVAGCLGRPHTTETSIYIKREALVVEVQPFALLPAQSSWVKVTSAAQIAAWCGFFDRVLPNVARRPVGDSMTLPWPWPPSKEGKVYAPDAQEELIEP